jgi:protein gp37
MSDKTEIEWTDSTWNPTTGCTKVSSGCDHCYAEKITERFHGKGSFAEVKLHPDRLDKPLHWKKPRRIFVNSMSDLFHQDVPDEFIEKVFVVMASTPQHTYQILTKRHARMRSVLKEMTARRESGAVLSSREWPLRNVWLGVSVESQQWADIRIPALLETPAAVRFLSCEPLLGPVDLSAWLDTPPSCGCGVAPDGAPGAIGCSAECVEPEPSGLGWCIVGGESGLGSRPMHPQWARSLRDQCVQAGVPFLFKQWGEWSPLPVPNETADRLETDHDVRADGYHWPISEPHGAEDGTEVLMRRAGKKAAGRELDGRLWDQYPDAAE